MSVISKLRTYLMKERKLEAEGLDPNFGHDACGYVTWRSMDDALWNIAGSKFTLSEAGTATSITALLAGVPGCAEGYKYAIYDASLNFLRGTGEGTTAGMVTLNLTSPIDLPAGDYWLLVWAKGLYDTVNFYYDAGGVNQGLYDYRDYNAWEDPITPAAYEDRKYCIYCTYFLPPPPAANPLIGKPLIAPDIIKRAKIR